MTDQEGNALEGGCTCGAVRYRLKARPIFVHCCHCTWCQRETGSTFAVNAFAEASQVELLKGKLTQSMLPSASGKGQVFWPCADCGVTVWSNYPQAGQNIHFIRVGTLDDPSRAPPDIHIYTSTKQPGWSCRTAFLRSQNSTGQPIIGRPKARRDSERREQAQGKSTSFARVAVAELVRFYFVVSCQLRGSHRIEQSACRFILARS
jgi:hypothetical protein